jgi:hypothetical protein
MDDSFIFKPTIKNTTHNNEYYTILGSEDFIDDNNNPRIKNNDNTQILAKKVVRSDNSIKFLVKLSNNGKIYNPISIYGEERQSNFLDSVCKSSDKFIEVNGKVFEAYIKFLKTKNKLWLHNAEREML